MKTISIACIKNVVAILFFLLFNAGLIAQLPTVIDKKTGQPIKFVGEEQVLKGIPLKKALSSTLLKPVFGGSQNQVVKKQTTNIKNGNKTVTLYRQGIESSFNEQRKKLNNDVSCYTMQYEVNIQNDNPQLMNPMSDVLYPGSVIEGTSVPSGAYTPVTVIKNPLLIYIDGLNFKAPYTITQEVQNPTAASVKSAILKLLNQPLNGPQAALLTEQTHEVTSAEEIKILVNTHFNGFGVDISNALKFENSTSSYNVVTEFTQQYYSISIVPPVSPADWFATQCQIQNHWTYVSSINYGRRAMLAISIYNSEGIIDDEFKAEVNSFLASGGVQGSTKIKTAFSRASVKGFFIGGNPQGATSITGTPEQCLSRFHQLKQSGAVYSSNTPALPLSYTLRFVNNNSVAMVGQSLKYSERYCDDVLRYKVTIDNIKCNNADDQGEHDNPEEIYGYTDIFLKTGNSPDVSINPLLGQNARVFERSRGSAYSLKTGNVIPINTSRFFDINAKTNNLAYFKFKSQLKEKDGEDYGPFDSDSDDTLPLAEPSLFLSSVNKNGTPYKGKIGFSSGKTNIELNYSITVVSKSQAN